MKNALGPSSRMFSVVAATVLALACAATTGPVRAADSGQYLTQKVAYGDLNLDTAAGAKALYVRLRYAAKYVCYPVKAEPRDLNGFKVWQTCVDDALASAVGQIDNPLLSALHNLKVNVTGAG